jgi:hypothetical protein
VAVGTGLYLDGFQLAMATLVVVAAAGHIAKNALMLIGKGHFSHLPLLMISVSPWKRNSFPQKSFLFFSTKTQVYAILNLVISKERSDTFCSEAVTLHSFAVPPSLAHSILP